MHDNIVWRSKCSTTALVFNVDVRSIDWKHYYQEIHLPGLRRHVLKSGEVGDPILVENSDVSAVV